MCISLPVPELSIGFVLFVIAVVWILGIILIPIIGHEDWEAVRKHWKMLAGWPFVIGTFAFVSLSAILWDTITTWRKNQKGMTS